MAIYTSNYTKDEIDEGVGLGLASPLNIYKSIVAAICASSIDGFTVTETTNAEWDYILTDSEDRIIAGVKTDGSLYIADIDSRGNLGSYTIAQIDAAIDSISGKEDKMTVVTQNSGTTLTAAVGNYYRFTYNVGTLAITLPTPTGSNAQSVLFFMTTGASPAVTFTSTGNTIYKNDGFAIDASTTYEINALWNGGAWVINAVKYTT